MVLTTLSHGTNQRQKVGCRSESELQTLMDCSTHKLSLETVEQCRLSWMFISSLLVCSVVLSTVKIQVMEIKLDTMPNSLTCLIVLPRIEIMSDGG